MTTRVRNLTILWTGFAVLFLLIGPPGSDRLLPHEWCVVSSPMLTLLSFLFYSWGLSTPFVVALWVVNFFRWAANTRQALIAIPILAFGFAAGYWLGRYPRNVLTLNSAARHEPWVAHFKIPGSIDLPGKPTVIECAFKTDDQIMALGGMFQATFTNLKARNYLLEY